jgi:tRNA/tmRNA/rRNA uracil-C5-methylase (TrmA/RlmC/RlmD family)
VIDPSRSGCDDIFLKQLNDFKPKKVVYVSCNPATQARDIKALVLFGYRIKRVVPFDIFPQTRHVECVVTLMLE